VSLSEKNLERFENEGLHKVFKLQTTMTTTSMMLFDELGCMTKFNHVNEILEHFYKMRLELYVKRKAYLLGMLRAEAKKLQNQARSVILAV
jgi:DNA topoisomerase II